MANLLKLVPPVLPPPSLGGMIAPPALPALQAPALPAVRLQTPSEMRLGADQNELTRLRTTGSGVSQITHPLDGSSVGLGHKILGGLARVGDTALSIAAPGIAAQTLGTTLHNLHLQNIEQGNVNNDLGGQKTQAETTLLDAQPELKRAALENQNLRLEGQQEHWQDQNDIAKEKAEGALRQHGYKHDDKGNVVPLPYEELSQDQQGLHDYRVSREELNAATSDLKKAQTTNIPVQVHLAEARLANAQRQTQVAMGRLALAGQNTDMRRQMIQANLYGTDLSGNDLPGAPQLEGDDGQLHTVGLRAASNAEKQQGKVTAFNDLQGSAQHAREALDTLHASGGDLSDPRVVAAMSDPHSLVGQVINGKIVKAGLSDQQVAAIGALNQLREQIGIMRQTTGGPAAEAQAQRMLAALPGAGDAKNTATNKMDELGGVLDRLRPGAVHVSSGMSVKGQPAKSPQNYKQTATGPGGHKIGSNDGGNTWFDTKTGAKVQ